MIDERPSDLCAVWPWLVVLLASACSQSGTTWLGTEALDGAGGSGGAVAATPLAPRFDEPRLITALASPATDDDPTATADLLELYFSSDRMGNEDLWVSTRAAPENPWGEPTPVLELSSGYIDATPGIAPDGLTIWFESTRLTETSDLLGTDIFVSTRSSRNAAWSAPVPVDDLNTTGRDSAPLPSTALLLTFSSWRADTAGDTDIYLTQRASAAEPWEPPSRLAEVNSSSWEQGLLRAGGDEIFISSGRAASRQGGNFFWSARPAPGAPFLEPSPLDDLNSDADDQDIWVSEDSGYAVFASDRGGNLDVYEAFRGP